MGNKIIVDKFIINKAVAINKVLVFQAYKVPMNVNIRNVIILIKQFNQHSFDSFSLKKLKY